MFAFCPSNPLNFQRWERELSLHHGFVVPGWGGRIKGDDAHGAKHRGGALGGSGNGSLGSTVAEAEVDDAHALDRVQRLCGRDIETCRLELLFQSTMNHERKCSDEYVSFNAIVGAMVDRAHVEAVFEIGKGALDIGKFLVKPHGVDRGQVGLFSLDDVFALISLLAGKMHWMLEEAKDAGLVRPIVIPMTMSQLQNSLGAGVQRTRGEGEHRVLQVCVRSDGRMAVNGQVFDRLARPVSRRDDIRRNKAAAAGQPGWD